MKKSQIDEILAKVQKQAAAVAKVRSILPNRPQQDLNNNGVPDDEEEYVPVGVGGLLSASQKLLAINRGLDKPDERDSLLFKRILTTDKLLSERIKLDSDRVRGSMLPLIARHKNLKAVGPFAFDAYMEKFLIGNPLSSPLEEINPLHLLEQSRRTTQMGPGGIGTDNAITESMQAIRTDQFGFLSLLEGPECFVKNTSILSYSGWMPIEEITLDTELACNIDGRLEYHKPSRVIKEPYSGKIISARHNNIRMDVTPTHRIYYSSVKRTDWSKYKVSTAEALQGKFIRIPCWHLPYVGKNSASHFDLPGVGSVSAEDFLSFMGWFLSEGNITDPASGNLHVVISQSEKANPDCYVELETLLHRMGIKFTRRKNGPCKGDKQGIQAGFLIYNPPLHTFLLSYVPDGRLCHEKGFPEDLLEYSIEARRALLRALMQGDGRINKTHNTYCTTSHKLALGVERLMLSLGIPCRIREEPDSRPHVKTMNYAVCQLKVTEKSIWGKSYGHKNYPGKEYGNHWSEYDYSGMVYCATVPGGKLYIRGSEETQGYWTGNSEKIGIDTRMAWGAKIGSDGRPYQKFFNRRTGKYQWMSPEDLDGLTIKVPD